MNSTDYETGKRCAEDGPQPASRDISSEKTSTSRDGPPPHIPDELSPSFEQAEGPEIDFHSLEWWQAALVMIAETISLGILSLPAVLANIGLVPGVVLIVALGGLSTLSGLMMGQFRRAHPGVQSFGDAGEVLGRAVGWPALGRELLGGAQAVFQVFVMGSHLLTWTICLNTLTDGRTCTVAWAFVGLAVFWLLNLPRTLKYTSYMSIASFLSIFTAVLTTMIDVAVERPIGSAGVDATRQLGFTSAFLSVSNIAIAFSGHSCFFGIMAELRRPDADWPRALALLQACDTAIYLVAAVVIYVYTGADVPAPALAAAGSTVVRKAIWGIATPTIVIAGVIYGHVAARYVFLRVFGGTRHARSRTLAGTAGWWAITLALWACALVIAESIPVFSSLLGLVCALFASWFSYGIPAVLWLFLHRGNWFRDAGRAAMFAASLALLLTGCLLCVLGLWSSAEAIRDEAGTDAWTCKSNA
ncbi:transmembrane amino acid transporter protein-domain-containing protein [Xylariaceae sp. FL0804]|nr:transmembrane amino acid transporter protein-domain-containing protein [Xylariaceae sp. FL0804]